MRKMKRFLVMGALVLALTACGEGEPGREETQVQSSEVQQEIEIVKESVVSTEKPQSKDKLPEFKKTATIDETVLYEADGVKITATGLNYDEYSANLTVSIENNTAKNLEFISGSTGYNCNSVNGYMSNDGYLNCSVAAGKKAMDTIEFDYDPMRMFGITEIADLEIGFLIQDEEYERIYTGPITILTSAAASHDYAPNYYQETIVSEKAQNTFGYSVQHFETGILYEDSGMSIRSKGMLEKDGEQVMLLEVRNDNDYSVSVSGNNLSWNGLCVSESSYTYDTVNPGKTRIIMAELEYALEDREKETLGIEHAGSVSMLMKFTDGNYGKLATPARMDIILEGAETSYDESGTEVYNQNGIRILAKGVVASGESYDENMYLYLILENNSDIPVTLADQYGSMSVNGYMVDYTVFSRSPEPGEKMLMEVTIYERGLEPLGITAPEQITELELGMELRDRNYKTLDDITISISTAEEGADASAPASQTASDEVRPEFREAMDGYEAFFDEYVTFMQAYKESTDALSMMNDYLNMMTRYAEAMSGIEEMGKQDMNTAEALYYAEVNARISAKLISVI